MEKEHHLPKLFHEAVGLLLGLLKVFLDQGYLKKYEHEGFADGCGGFPLNK